MPSHADGWRPAGDLIFAARMTTLTLRFKELPA